MYVYCKNDVLLVTSNVRKRGRYSCSLAEFIRADIADRNTLYVDYTACTVRQIIEALSSTDYLALQGIVNSDLSAVNRLRQEIIDLVHRPDPEPDEYVVTLADGTALGFFKSHEISEYANRYGFRADDIQPACQFRISGNGFWVEDVSWVWDIAYF